MREIIYIESESRVRKGKREDLIKKYPGWNIRELGGGNGKWLLTKNNDVNSGALVLPDCMEV